MPRQQMNDKWERNGDTIKVRMDPGAGRYIFGLPWFLFGVYFTYKFFILGIVEYIQAGAVKELLTSALPGFIFVLLLFGGIFLVPGFALTFLKFQVLIDAGRGEVDTVRDFIFYKQVKTRPFGDFKYVSVREVVTKSKSKRGTRRFYSTDVRLVAGKGRDYIPVASMGEEDEAFKLGREISALTKIPLRDENESD